VGFNEEAMNRCKLCLIPDTRPDTEFVDGVCSACITHAKRPEIDWEAREKELIQLLDRHNGRCIVPSSGGKDSHWQVLKLLELGADVTIVTASTCHLTEIGRKNIDNLARFARTIEYSPNKTVRAKLNRLGLEMVGDASWPQHASIWAIPFQAAIDLKIPLLIWGENSQAQYGGPIGSDEAKQMTRRWTSEFGGLNGMRASDFVGLEGITKRDMQDYMMPSDDDIKNSAIEAHFLGAYYPWDSHRNAEVAILNGMQTMLPCKANYWEFENLDCMVTALHDAGMYRKFGYGRGCAQISVDIRNGLISRQSALNWVKQNDGSFPWEYMGTKLDVALDRMDMSRTTMMEHINRFTNWDLFGEFSRSWDRPITKDFIG
jgi:N-acetyl sugar amidotransferase